VINIYLAWIITCIFRGLFVAEYYWDFKNLINAGFALILVNSIYVFSNPVVLQLVFRTWIRLALPLFLIILFFLTTDSFGYYLVPISILTLFFTAINLKWKLIILGISFFVVFVDYEARSNVIKFLLPILLSLLSFFPRFIRSKWFVLINGLLFTLPFLLMSLAAAKTFNVFKMDDYISGVYTETKHVGGKTHEINLKADTRTSLYIEVVGSALKHHYILFGRTPARGNESEIFGSLISDDLKTGRKERYSNEVSILNIFTWMGLLGVVLYLLVFLKAARLAVLDSNSDFLKLIGLYISFRWTYAWVEDFNRLDIMNVTLFLTLAICFSSGMRQMSNKEVKYWVNSIFNK
jgi:hypothetical protein